MKITTASALSLLLSFSAAFSWASPAAPAAPSGITAAADPQIWLSWPEAQRAFLQDGPGLLLTEEQRNRLLALDEAGRDAFIREFIDKDPVPETPVNELEEGIQRRLRLVQSEFLSPRDVRAQLIFLNGPPAERLPVDCGTAFRPLEIWTYDLPAGAGDGAGSGKDAPKVRLVVYKSVPDEPFRLWRRTDGKRVLYTPDMEYFLDQWEEYGGRRIAKRFDLQICKQAELVDKATGIDGLSNVLRGKYKESASDGTLVTKRYYDRVWPWQKAGDPQPFLEPGSLAAWAKQAMTTPLPAGAAILKTSPIEVQFPAKDGQRMLVRGLVSVEPNDKMAAPDDEGKPRISLVADGVIESEGKIFETFRVRFRMGPQTQKIPLTFDRQLRTGKAFLLRLRLTDEASGATVALARGFQVPEEPVATPAVAGAFAAEEAQNLAEKPKVGPDTLLLIPPPEDIVLGLWRAEAIVTGEKITKVTFLVDGQAQLTRGRPPYSAELRLNTFPVQQVIRAEGYDAQGQLLAADEILINQPRGAFQVTILNPPRGSRPTGRITARAEISVPGERRIELVEFKVDDKLVTKREKPPWEAEIDVPTQGDTVYLAVSAVLDDGSRAEEVRFLRAPEYLEEVDVNLIELYVAVNDRSGQLVPGLTAADFQVLEGGERREIEKFELVENLPLTVGIALDTSGSMTESLAEAQKAAAGFLSKVVTHAGDRCFALTFSGKPYLQIPLTDDVEAVSRTLDGLQAYGATALHDAVVQSLYYFRGTRGQKALILLSDGDDTASSIQFKDALEYAKRSGVAIYSIGLDVGATSVGVRGKLANLAEETGGRVFYISKATDLANVYREIELELRNRYLLAFNAAKAAEKAGYRPIEVKVLKSGLKARTARGYYP